MDATKEKSPTARSGCTCDLASNVCIDSILGSAAHQHTAVLTVSTQAQRFVGGAE